MELFAKMLGGTRLSLIFLLFTSTLSPSFGARFRLRLRSRFSSARYSNTDYGGDYDGDTDPYSETKISERRTTFLTGNFFAILER